MLYIVRNFRTRPTHLTTYWVNIRGIFNPTLIDRVNKLMTNNIRSTYNCHTFLESSDKSIKPYIGLISGVILTLYPNIGLIQIGLRNLFSVRSSKPLVIKLIVEVKVVPNLNRA